MSLPTRDEVPDHETWDPSLVFDSPDEWDAAAAAFERRLEDLREFAGRATADGETLLDLLNLVEEVQVRRLGSLWLYASLTAYVDTTDEAARERMGRYRTLRAEMEDALSFLEPELQRAGRERISELVASTPALESHEAHLERLLAGAEHTLSPETELALAELGPSLRAGSDVGSDIAEGDVDYPTVETPTGETVTLTGNAHTRLLQSPDREFRREVYERHYEALADHRHGMAAAYVAQVRATCRLASVRGYESALAMRLGGEQSSQAGEFPVEAYETVVDGVADRFGPYHRLMAARQERLDGDDLREWDITAPLVPGDPPEVPYETATDLLLDALEPLGEAYADRLAELLEERRVDVRQTANKRRGPKAILLASAADGPFVACSYDGDLRSFYLFAHELGHAMNRLLASEHQRPIDEGVPVHTGEVPSFVHEALLVDHLTEVWDGTDAHHAQVTFLDKLPLYRAARGARFIHDLHEVVADGADPGPDALDDRYREVVSSFREPVTLDERAGTGWQRQDLSRRPYHAYIYAVGSVGALAIARSLREGDLSAETYREMLSRGRSVPSNEAFAPVLDFTDRGAVERGIEAYADRVERLLAALDV